MRRWCFWGKASATAAEDAARARRQIADQLEQQVVQFGAVFRREHADGAADVQHLLTANVVARHHPRRFGQGPDPAGQFVLLAFPILGVGRLRVEDGTLEPSIRQVPDKVLPVTRRPGEPRIAAITEVPESALEQMLRRQAGDGDTEGRAGNVVVADHVTPLNRVGIAAVFATDTHFEVRAGGATFVDRPLHELAHAVAVNRLERIRCKNFFIQIVIQESADIIARKTETHLGKIVGSV